MPLDKGAHELNQIDQIYKKTIEDLRSLITNQYRNNADGYNQVANNDSEAIDQILSGSIKPIDCKNLQELVKNNVECYLEIGSYVGLSFRVFNEIFRPKLSFSVDPNIPHRVFHNPRSIFHRLNSEFSNRTVAIDAFWLKGEKSINALYFNNHIKFDLIFIDGDHSYDSVKSDFFECCKILSDNGTILLHDIYSWGGVGQFAEELKKDHRFSVVFAERKNSFDGFCAVTMNGAFDTSHEPKSILQEEIKEDPFVLPVGSRRTKVTNEYNGSKLNWDINLCVLACAKSEKYSRRLREFIDSYGYKLENKDIRAKVTFLVEDEPKPDFLDDSFGWYNCPGMPLSCRLLKYLKDEPADARWLMQVDDDSSTDIDKTIELLGQYYDHRDALLLMGGRNTDLERSQQNILRLMKVDNFFFGSKDINKFDTTPYFIHAWEPSIFSASAIGRIKAWDRLEEFYGLCLKYRPIFGDQVPYVAARMSMVPIVECLFMSPFSKSEEYSAVVPDGRFSHIHYVTEKWSGYERLRRRMLEGKGRPQDKNPEELPMWDFWADEAGSRRHIAVLTLKEDRTVGLYDHENEHYWDMVDDKLIFLNRDNRPTSVLHRISDSEYSGKFLLNGAITHTLKRAD